VCYHGGVSVLSAAPTPAEVVFPEGWEPHGDWMVRQADVLPERTPLAGHWFPTVPLIMGRPREDTEKAPMFQFVAAHTSGNMVLHVAGGQRAGTFLAGQLVFPGASGVHRQTVPYLSAPRTDPDAGVPTAGGQNSAWWAALLAHPWIVAATENRLWSGEEMLAAQDAWNRMCIEGRHDAVTEPDREAWQRLATLVASPSALEWSTDYMLANRTITDLTYRNDGTRRSPVVFAQWAAWTFVAHFLDHRYAGRWNDMDTITRDTADPTVSRSFWVATHYMRSPEAIRACALHSADFGVLAHPDNTWANLAVLLERLLEDPTVTSSGDLDDDAKVSRALVAMLKVAQPDHDETWLLDPDGWQNFPQTRAGMALLGLEGHWFLKHGDRDELIRIAISKNAPVDVLAQLADHPDEYISQLARTAVTDRMASP
jgi:hypothetical protein